MVVVMKFINFLKRSDELYDTGCFSSSLCHQYGLLHIMSVSAILKALKKFVDRSKENWESYNQTEGS